MPLRGGRSRRSLVRQAPANVERLFGVFDFGRLLDHALAAVEAIRSDPVAQMGLTRLRVDGERGLLESVVRTVHTARRGRLAALLNGHFFKLLSNYWRFNSSASCSNGFCVSSSRPLSAS